MTIQIPCRQGSSSASFLPSFMTGRVLSVLVMEASERFSYYGFRAVLVLYFSNYLGFSDSLSVSLFSYTSSLAYFSPLLGAVVSDSYLGRYRTILLFGFVYLFGLMILTVGAFSPTNDNNNDNTSQDHHPYHVHFQWNVFLSFLGLFFICIGTGGIKPCVSAFGADQVVAQSQDRKQILSTQDEQTFSIHPKANEASSFSVTSKSTENDRTSIRRKPSSSSSNNQKTNETLPFVFVTNSTEKKSLLSDADNNNKDNRNEPDGSERSRLHNSKKDNGGDEPKDGDFIQQFYAWFYFSINLGAVGSYLIIPSIRSRYGYGTAFLIPALFLVFAICCFLSKRNEYVKHMPRTSSLPMKNDDKEKDDFSLLSTLSLICILLRRRFQSLISSSQEANFTELLDNKEEENEGRKTHHDELDIAIEDEKLNTLDTVALPALEDSMELPATSKMLDSRYPPNQLQDALETLQVLPVLAMLPVFWMLYDQNGSAWTLQASHMNLHGWNPEQLGVINPVLIMVFIPLFDKIIYPMVTKWGWDTSHLQKMKVGMFLTSLSFFCSGFLDTLINSKTDKDDQDPTISVFWQLPQIFILSTAEILVSVTGLEFSYTYAPASMKALIMALYLLTSSVGDLLSGLLYSCFGELPLSSLMYFCALLMLINLVCFHFICMSLVISKEK